MRWEPGALSRAKSFHRHDSRLDGVLRATCLQLNEAAWKAVRVPGDNMDSYVLALRQADAAVRALPGKGSYLNRLGVAHYRLGNHAEALQTLVQSEKLNASKE